MQSEVERNFGAYISTLIELVESEQFNPTNIKIRISLSDADQEECNPKHYNTEDNRKKYRFACRL